MIQSISKNVGRFLICLAGFGLLAAGVEAGRPAPKPIGPDGRAVYRTARLLDVGSTVFGELVRLGFDVEVNGAGEVIGYLSPEEMDKLEALNIAWVELPDPALELWLSQQRGEAKAGTLDQVHTYETLTSELQQIASDHPSITRLTSLGKTVQGREMWVMKITDNPDQAEDEPAFKYFSTIHGDEIVGMENCLKLIHWLTDNYGTLSRATNLVNEVEIWIGPNLNPDGTTLHQRYNANGVDLNRDFPDQFEDPNNTTTGRAKETQNIMNWQFGKTTNLSANFHGGALVVNYPYDGTASHQSVYSESPDDDIFIDLSLDYSEDNGPMYNGEFDQGITNGAAWYVIYGGMQDWNYIWQGDQDLTIEVSNNKWPSASTLPQFWNENQESMISLLERALSGVRGVITDGQTGEPVSARLRIEGREHQFFTDPEVGDFHRPLKIGNYNLVIEADGYDTRTVPFTVTSNRGPATRVDVVMGPLPTSIVYSANRVNQDSNADGYFEAGETGQLAVTLRNNGKSAAGIQGQLIPLTSYSTVTSAAVWPDLSAGQSGETLPPHFGLDVASDAPAGHKLGFAVAWQTGTGDAGTTEAFFLPLGPPITTTHSSTDKPKSIPDSGQAVSVLPIDFDREIAELNVYVNITHPYIGDLRVTLIAPDGTDVVLHDRTGGSTDNLRTIYDTQTQPVGSLTAFETHSTLGTWSLRVEDLAAGNTGQITAWGLKLITRDWEPQLPEVLLQAMSLTPEGKVQLDWWPVGSAWTYRVYRSSDPSQAGAFQNVTPEDPSATDTRFLDASSSTPGSLMSWLVTALGYQGEGAWGHFGQ